MSDSRKSRSRARADEGAENSRDGRLQCQDCPLAVRNAWEHQAVREQRSIPWNRLPEEWSQRNQAIQNLGEARGGGSMGYQAHRTVTVARTRLLVFPFWVTTYNSKRRTPSFDHFNGISTVSATTPVYFRRSMGMAFRLW